MFFFFIRVIWSTGLLVFRMAGFMAVDVVYTKERAGKGGSFAEGYKERFVDLSLRVNKDSAEEKYESADT